MEDRIAHGVPVWQSRYFGEWDNQRLYNGSGAYHGSEIPMLFGSGEEVTGISNSDAQERYSRYMGAAWAAFSRDPHRGLEEVGWPAFNTSGKSYSEDFLASGSFCSNIWQSRNVFSLVWDIRMGHSSIS